MSERTMATQQVYRSTKTMTFMSQESSFSRSVFMSDAVDACYENGVGRKVVSHESRKETFKGNGQVNGTEYKSFIQQRVERLYGPGALAQGFFVSKRMQRKSESDNENKLKVPAHDLHSMSMDEKLLDDEHGMKQSSSSPTLPVLRHLRPEFRAQLPIINPRRSAEGMQKSVTVPKLTEKVNGVNGHSNGEAKVETYSDRCDKMESVPKDGHYFLLELEREANRLLKIADQVEREANMDYISEEIKEKLRSAYGKARLLVSQKMEQFRGLCANNINQTNDEQFPTTNEDLQGFWDMVMLQVVQVNNLFEEIDVIRKNNWKLIPEDSTGRVTVVIKKPSKKAMLRPKTTGSEQLRIQRDAERKQLMEAKRKAMKAQMVGNKNVEIYVPQLS